MLPLLLGVLPRSVVPRGALPVPAHGGRSLWVIVVPRVVAPELPPFDGRFEELLPNPAGGRPRSEEFPCASHVRPVGRAGKLDRKSTRLNSSHLVISYAVFCLTTK